MFNSTSEFSVPFGEAMKLAQVAALKRNDKQAIATFKKLQGKKQGELNPSEKSFVIRWYLRSFEE